MVAQPPSSGPWPWLLSEEGGAAAAALRYGSSLSFSCKEGGPGRQGRGGGGGCSLIHNAKPLYRDTERQMIPTAEHTVTKPHTATQVCAKSPLQNSTYPPHTHAPVGMHPGWLPRTYPRRQRLPWGRHWEPEGGEGRGGNGTGADLKGGRHWGPEGGEERKNPQGPGSEEGTSEVDLIQPSCASGRRDSREGRGSGERGDGVHQAEGLAGKNQAEGAARRGEAVRQVQGVVRTLSVEVSEMKTLDRGSFSAWAATCGAA